MVMESSMKKLFALMLPVILFGGIWINDASAQNNSKAYSTDKFAQWDASKTNSSDVAVTAIIQQVNSSHASGSPAGLHLMLGTPQGPLDASVGPYISPEIQQALTAGQRVTVVGRVLVANSQTYLLARQFMVGDRQITVRNDRGFLIHTLSGTGRRSKFSKVSQNGGVQ
jgi:hypothetical protein